MSGVGGPYSILFRSTDLKIMFSVQFHRAHVMDVSPCSQHRKRTPAPPFWSYVFLSCLILHETFAAVFFAVFFCFDFSATCFLVGRSEFWSKPYYPKPVESLTQISWIQSQVASDWWFLETQDKEKKTKNGIRHGAIHEGWGGGSGFPKTFRNLRSCWWFRNPAFTSWYWLVVEIPFFTTGFFSHHPTGGWLGMGFLKHQQSLNIDAVWGSIDAGAHQTDGDWGAWMLSYRDWFIILHSCRL